MNNQKETNLLAAFMYYGDKRIQGRSYSDHFSHCAVLTPQKRWFEKVCCGLQHWQ